MPACPLKDLKREILSVANVSADFEFVGLSCEHEAFWKKVTALSRENESVLIESEVRVAFLAEVECINRQLSDLFRECELAE